MINYFASSRLSRTQKNPNANVSHPISHQDRAKASNCLLFVLPEKSSPHRERNPNGKTSSDTFRNTNPLLAAMPRILGTRVKLYAGLDRIFPPQITILV